jgi:hypothetical protein
MGDWRKCMSGERSYAGCRGGSWGSIYSRECRMSVMRLLSEHKNVATSA